MESIRVFFFFVAHVVSGIVILDMFFWVINFTPKTSLQLPQKMGICSRILPNLDLFFWWCFTDCTVVNHHEKPQFGEYDFCQPP